METKSGNFSTQVEEAASLVRSRRYESVGNCDFAKSYSVKSKLGWRTASPSPAYVGRVVRELFSEIIESQFKPSTPIDLSSRDWRIYTILRKNIVDGNSGDDIAKELGIGRTMFYEERKNSLDALVSALWNLEQKSRHRSKTIDQNLPEAPFAEYVPIEDEQGNDYATTILNALTTRAWIFILVGPGGTGKTSLAYEVATRAANNSLFDAVIWTSAKQNEFNVPGATDYGVGVSPIRSLDSILDNIGGVLGIRKILATRSHKEKIDLVLPSLSTVNSLLVIDDMDSLDPEAHAEILSFLEKLPSPSKAMVTSRQRLLVPGMSFTLRGMNEREAYTLIEFETERQGFRSFELTEKQAIYRGTNGSPLAMKLAVALVANEGYRIQDAVGIGIEQHKLLDFMFEGTYERLLNDNDRKVLHVLPLFLDPATMYEISAAANVGPVQTDVSLIHLKGLYFVVAPASDKDRNEILPSLRAFLIKQREHPGRLIGDSGLNNFIREANERLASYYVEYLRTIDRVDAKISFLANSRKNLLSSMAWCYENERWEVLLELFDEIGPALGSAGFVSERGFWAEKALKACEHLRHEEMGLWIRVRDLVWVLLQRGESSSATAMLATCLQASKASGYKRVEALCYGHLGRVAQDDRRYEEAREYFEKALAIWGEIGKPSWYADSFAKLGLIALEQNDLDKAEKYLNEALLVQRGLEDTGAVVQTMSDLALVRARKKLPNATQLAQDSISMARGLSQEPSAPYGFGLYRLAQVEFELGNRDEALRDAQGALKVYSDLAVEAMIGEVRRFIDHALKH